MSVYIQRLVNEWSYKTNFLCPLQWEEVTTDKTEKMMFHTGAIINDYIYLHGGSSDSHQFSTPMTTFYRFHLKKQSWENLMNYPNCPALSNHASISFDRFLILIGGWNGEKCESNVYIFDTKFLKWKTSTSVGLPPDMEGLACHTANVIKSNRHIPEILILASNTKVRKHYTVAFKLISNDDLSVWNFTKLPNRVYFQLDHATTSISKSTLHCIGGNLTKLLQKFHVHKIIQDPKDKLVSTLITHVEDKKFNKISSTRWSKEACRGHSIISGTNGFLILNGIKYNTSADYTKKVFIYLNLGSKRGLYYVGDIIKKMAFGVCLTDPQSGSTYYHGGNSDKNERGSHIFQLNFVFYDKEI